MNTCTDPAALCLGRSVPKLLLRSDLDDLVAAKFTELQGKVAAPPPHVRRLFVWAHVIVYQDSFRESW